MKLLPTIFLLLVLKPTAVTATAEAKAAAAAAVVATLRTAPSQSFSLVPNDEIELWNRSSRQRQTSRLRGSNVSNYSSSSTVLLFLLCCCRASLQGGDEFSSFVPGVNVVAHDAVVDARKATWQFQTTIARIRGGDNDDSGAVTNSSLDNEEENDDEEEDADNTHGEEAAAASVDAINAIEVTNGSAKAEATTANDILDDSTSTENSIGHSTESLSLDHGRALKASNFAPPTSSSSSNNRPSLPPLYRFLLRYEGGGAHILLTIVVWSVEWIRLYLPLVASLGLYLVRWISLKLFGHDGTSSSSNNGSYRRGLFGKKTKPPSRREQKQLEAERVRQADLVAYQQLMQLQKQSSGSGGRNGPTSNKHNKYRHVSWDFIRRHGLGMATASSSAVATTEAAVSSVLSSKTSVTNMPKTSATDSASSHSSVVNNSKRRSREEEIDWMVDALSTPSTKNSLTSKRNSKRTAKQVDAIINALQTAQQKLEEEDNDDDISLSAAASAVGNAASGLLSRSRLLGAYPGDAPSIDDAANSAVLEALAEERYGYGDWNDDDDGDDDDDEGDMGDDDVKGVNDFEDKTSPRINRSTSKRPRATTRRTKPPNSQTNIAYEAKATASQQRGDAGFMVDSNESERRRRRTRRRSTPALSVKFEFHSTPSATASASSREAPSRHAPSSTRTQPTVPSKPSEASNRSTQKRDEPKSSTAQSDGIRPRDRSSSILDTLKSSRTSNASLSDLISPKPTLRSTDPPLSLSSILNNRINSETTTTTSPSPPQETTTSTSIRPAMQLLNEHRQQLQQQVQQDLKSDANSSS